MASQAQSGGIGGLFFHLPQEVRVKIYQVALDTPEHRDSSGFYDNKLTECTLNAKLGALRRLCAICGPMRQEVLSEFSSRSVVHLYARFRAATVGPATGHTVISRLSRPQLGVYRFRESSAALNCILSCPMLPANIQHCSWLWTGMHNVPDQSGALTWLQNLTQLKSLEIIIEDPYIYRNTVLSLQPGHGRLPYGTRNINLFNVINASQICQLRGLEKLQFRLDFQDPSGAKLARWTQAVWWTAFVTRVKTDVIGQVNGGYCHGQAVQHRLGALDGTRPVAERLDPRQ